MMIIEKLQADEPFKSMPTDHFDGKDQGTVLPKNNTLSESKHYHAGSSMAASGRCHTKNQSKTNNENDQFDDLEYG